MSLQDNPTGSDGTACGLAWTVTLSVATAQDSALCSPVRPRQVGFVISQTGWVRTLAWEALLLWSSPSCLACGEPKHPGVLSVTWVPHSLLLALVTGQTSLISLQRLTMTLQMV